MASDIFVETTSEKGTKYTKLDLNQIPDGESVKVKVLAVSKEEEGNYGPYIFALLEDDETGEQFEVRINGSLRAPGFSDDDKPKRFMDYILDPTFPLGKTVSIVRWEKKSKMGRTFSTYWIGEGKGGRGQTTWEKSVV